EIEREPRHRRNAVALRVEILLRRDAVAETPGKNPIEFEPLAQERRIDRIDRRRDDRGNNLFPVLEKAAQLSRLRILVERNHKDERRARLDELRTHRRSVLVPEPVPLGELIVSGIQKSALPRRGREED